MNKIAIVLLVFFGAGLTGCSKRFAPLYANAQAAYAEDNWIETIDNINLALPFWRESDGQEQKAQAYQLLGKAYHKLKKIDKASESYAKAVELSTNTYESAYELGMIYLISKQTSSSIKSFKEVLKMKKDDPWALVGLGNAYYDEGNYNEARAFYQRVIDSSPGVREAIDFLRLIEQKEKTKVVTSPKKPKRGFMQIKKR
jgi:tetratricopeptide (TPR) repeat protein